MERKVIWWDWLIRFNILCNLRDIRVLSYTALRNKFLLVQAVIYFVSAELRKKIKLNLLLKKIYETAKRFFGIPEFRQYAIADGIYKVLFTCRTAIVSPLKENRIRYNSCFPLQLNSRKNSGESPAGIFRLTSCRSFVNLFALCGWQLSTAEFKRFQGASKTRISLCPLKGLD